MNVVMVIRKRITPITNDHFLEILFSGADLAALIREAAEIAMTEHISKSLPTEDACVHQSHINRAFSKMLPSVSEKVIL